MLQITPQMRILVAVEAVDFRKGMDSLAELCRAKLNADPFSGCVFGEFPVSVRDCSQW
jgi:transposase